MKIFTSSKPKHAARWQALRTQGVTVVSTWVDDLAGERKVSHADQAAQRLRDIGNADLILLFCEQKEQPKEILLDAGAALAMGKRVACIGTNAALKSLYQGHPLWRAYPNVETALTVEFSLAPA